MKLRLKITLCVLLCAFAAWSLATVLGSLGVLPASAEESAVYVVREHDGFVGVFRADDGEVPVLMTDVPVQGLPLTARVELKNGVTAADLDEVMLLLEDFGS